MRGFRPYGLLLLAASLLPSLAKTIEARTDWGLGVSGNIGTAFQYTRERQGDVIAWRTEKTDHYTLGVDGKILDRRLATFNLGGAFTMSDFNSNQKSGADDSKISSFTGNLTLLPGKPYPLDLRIAQSHLSSKTKTDVFSFGGSWRINYGSLPSVFLSFDRINIESTGESRADTAFTTGTLRLAKRLFGADLDAELGVQDFTDQLKDTSNFRQFGRFSGTLPYSQATTMRLVTDYFLQEATKSFGANFSFINRPDPTLSRSFALGVRRQSGGDREETALDANGAISKAYQPLDTLSVTPFTTALLTQRFASGSGQGDLTRVNWAAGVSLVSSYFTPVLAIGDYGLGLSYDKEEEGKGVIGTIHQFHVGLQSRTLQPYNVRGDYNFILERTLTDRNRHTVSLRADGPVVSRLIFRSYAEFFNEDATFSGTQTKVSSKQTSANFGGGLSYLGSQDFYGDLGANTQWMDIEQGSFWITRITANINYRPKQHITVQLNGTRETDTQNELTRYEFITRVLYQFGKATINAEYRYESRESFGRPGNLHSIGIRINRPFRFSF